MQEYTTNTPRQAPGNAYKPLPRPHECLTTRLCECCQHPLKPTARRDARYCSETCRARAHDERTGRRGHGKAGEP